MTSPAESANPPDPAPDRGAQWTLAAQPDHAACADLQAFRSAHRDGPVSLSAEALRRPHTPLFQLLVAARRDWAARGLPFRVTGMPARVTALLPLLGLAPDQIGIEAR